MELFYYFKNLDTNTYTLLFLGFISCFFIFKNFFTLSSQTFFALIITIALFYYIIQKLEYNLNTDLSKIKDYNKLLKLDNFEYLPKDINLVVIYKDLYRFGRVDRYDFTDSMKSTERLLINYNLIKNSIQNYKQVLEKAEEERDLALNYLQCINNSVVPKYAINIDDSTIGNINNLELNETIQKLKDILDNYIFEMYRLCRNYYETEDITINSYPITLDMTAPRPDNNSLKNNFDLYYGFVLP
jgi:hypothetical protein